MKEFWAAVLIALAFVLGIAIEAGLSRNFSGWAFDFGDFLTQALAVTIGAWVAFRLERVRRGQELVDSQVTRANRVLLDLIQTYNDLQNYQSQVAGPSLATYGPAAQWAALPAVTMNGNRPDYLDTGNLDFLLGSGHSQLVAEVNLVRMRMEAFVRTVNEHARIKRERASPRWEAAGIEHGAAITGGAAQAVVGVAIYQELSDLAGQILHVLRNDPPAVADTIERLRSALAERFPGRTFIKIEVPRPAAS